jgi:hypothetical protein
MANIIKYVVILILLAPGSAFSATVWPGVYGHGAMWQLKDAPGSGTPILCIINTKDDGAASGSEDTDYNGTGQSVYVGNARYCIEMASEDGGGDANGKVVLRSVDGYIHNDQSPWIWYLEDSDWSIYDLDPPGAPGALAWRNIKLSVFDTDEEDEELTHFFIKDFLGIHGGGVGAENRAAGHSNRKSAVIRISESDQVLTDIVVFESTFLFGLDGPVGVGGESSSNGTDAKGVTVDRCVIGLAIAYTNDDGDWSSGVSYSKWDVVDNPAYTYPTVSNGPGYYECTTAHTSSAATEPGTGASWESYWEPIDADQTDKQTGAWKGLTAESIDGYTVRRSLFASNAQRNPLVTNMGAFNVDNNVIYNAFLDEGTVVVTWDSGSGEDDWIKGTFIGNVCVGGPHSNRWTDEYFPNLYAYQWGWYANIVDYNYSGGITSVSNNTLCDTSKSWDTDEHAGFEVRIIDGNGAGQDYKTISSNTATCLTIDENWDINPHASGDLDPSDYEIKDLSDHDIYIADTKLIECDSTPCASNYTVRQQDTLSNVYDWDYVANREEMSEAMMKHTSIPTGAHVDGYTPEDDDDVEDIVLAQDGTGAGAYNDDQDSVSAAVFASVAGRTDYRYKQTQITNSDFPSVSSTGSVTLDIPENMWGLCDEGYYRIEYWLHNGGDIEGCTESEPEPETLVSPPTGYSSNAQASGYDSNAPALGVH